MSGVQAGLCDRCGAAIGADRRCSVCQPATGAPSELVARAKAALEGVTEGPWEWKGAFPRSNDRDWLHGPNYVPVIPGVDGLMLTADIEFIAEARSLVPELADRVERFEAFTRELLEVSWSRLYDAHCWTAGNDGVVRWDREWSMQADSIAEDIRNATTLVGPIDLENVGMVQLASGWFARAVERIGLEGQPLPSEELLADCERYLMEQESRW